MLWVEEWEGGNEHGNWSGDKKIPNIKVTGPVSSGLLTWVQNFCIIEVFSLIKENQRTTVAFL